MKQNINLKKQLNEQLDKRTKEALNKELREIKMKLRKLKKNEELVEAKSKLYYELTAAICMIIDLQHDVMGDDYIA